MKYDLRKLAQMVAVARAGSFSGAADELHITQPALSRNVAALEKELGIKIFERGRKGASLTPAGALAVEATEALLREADSLEHNLAMFGTGDAGRLAFGMGPMLGSLIMPGLCREFLTQRPLLRLRSVMAACTNYPLAATSAPRSPMSARSAAPASTCHRQLFT